MAKDYFWKFRGCPSLTPKRKAELVHWLSTGLPINSACKAVGIVKDTYYRWMRWGRALRLGEESTDMLYFAPRQPGETDQEWRERKYRYDWECALLEDFFLTITQTIARKRAKWMRRMDQRSTEGIDMHANARC